MLELGDAGVPLCGDRVGLDLLSQSLNLLVFGGQQIPQAFDLFRNVKIGGIELLEVIAEQELLTRLR